jgi:hypothetical protein
MASYETVRLINTMRTHSPYASSFAVLGQPILLTPSQINYMVNLYQNEYGQR